MKRNVSVFVLFLSLMPVLAWAAVVADTHFNALGEGGWECRGEQMTPEIVTDPTSPDPPSVFKINFPAGMRDGYSPSGCSVTKDYNSDEIYRQLYVKFPVGYQHHSFADKLAYDYLDSNKYSDNPGNFATIAWSWDGKTKRHMMIYLQPNSTGSPMRNLFPNKTQTNIVDGNWYKITWYMKLNTSGSANGIARLWVNDVLNFEYTDVDMRQGGWGTRNFNRSDINPIFGGATEEKKISSDYFYMDRAIVSTTPIGGGSDSISIGKEPNPPNELIIK